MSKNPSRFKEIFNEAVDTIKFSEAKNKSDIEQDLATLVKKSPDTVRSWLKIQEKNMPNGSTVRILAKEIWSRKGFANLEMMEEFLSTAGFNDEKNLAQQMIEEINSINRDEQSNESKINTLSQVDMVEPLFNGANSQSRKFSIKLVLPIILVFLIVILLFSFVTLSLDTVRLATWYDHPVDLEINGVSVSNGGVIKTGEDMTASFRILNSGSRFIIIRTLVLGTNGPGVTCKDQLNKRWGKEGKYPFRPLTFIIVPPGKEYEYKVSRSFDEKGSYFAEPVIQNISGSWGGIQPFACIDFNVQ